MISQQNGARFKMTQRGFVLAAFGVLRVSRQALDGLLLLVLLIERTLQTGLSAPNSPNVLWTRGGHSDQVSALAVSPNGQLFLSGGRDETIKLWRVSNGSLFRTIHYFRPLSLTFSRDGTLFAGGGADNSVKVWRVSDGSVVHTFPQSDDVHSVDFSPDGQLIAAAGKGPASYIWNLQDGTIKHSFTGLKGIIRHVQFSPDGRFLANDDAYQVNMWRVNEGTLAYGITNESPTISNLAFSPDGQQFALAQNDFALLKGWISFHSIINGESIGTIPSSGTNTIFEINFSPDGQLIAGHDYNPYLTNRSLHFWNVGDKTLRRAIATDPFTTFFAFSPDWSWFVQNGTGQGAQITQVDRLTGNPMRRFSAHTEPVSKLVFTSNGRLISSSQNSMHSWRAMDGVLQWSLNHAPEVFSTMAISADGAEISIASHQPLNSLDSIHFRNGETGLASGRRLEPGEEINALAISPDGRWLATGGSATNIRIWNRSDLTLTSTLRGHTRSITSRIAFSPDSQNLISHASDLATRFWNVTNGQQLWAITNTGLTFDFAFSPDGSIVACADVDLKIRLRRTSDGAVANTLTNHTAVVRGVAFAPDNRTLLSCSDDDTIRVWNYTTGELLHTYDDSAWNCREIAVAENGVFAFGRADGTFAVAQGFGIPPLRLHATTYDSQGRFRMRLQGPAGSAFRVEASPDLRTWISITNAAFPNTEFELIHSNSDQHAHQFYRGAITD